MKDTPENPNDSVQPKNRFGFLRVFGGPLLILLAMVVIGRYAGRYWPDIETTVAQLGHSGLLLFFGSWVLLSLFCFPVAVLGVSAGALFGPWLGAGLVFPAGLVSGTIMFWLGRGLLRNRIVAYTATNPKLAAIDRLAGDQALKLNILTRLSPLNFGLACYTLATGRTTYRAYFWGMFAILPSLVGQVWFGSLAREAGRSTSEGSFSKVETGLLVVGVVFFGLLTWVVGRMIKKAMNEAPADDIND